MVKYFTFPVQLQVPPQQQRNKDNLMKIQHWYINQYVIHQPYNNNVQKVT